MLKGYEQVVLDDSPVLYLRLGESSGATATDSSGNGLNGTYQSSPTLGVVGAIPLESDTAVTLNGSSQYITVVDNTLLDPGDTISLEAWVLRVGNVVPPKIIFDKGNDAYYLSHSLGILEFGGGNIGGAFANSTTAITENIWCHVVCTKNGSDVHIYINGVDVTGTVTNDTILANSTDLYIGRASGGSFFFNGSLDEIAIYSTALSADRVKAHYTVGTATNRDAANGIGLVEIDWDSGTEYYSFVGVRSPSHHYDDLVMEISPIHREVALFGGAFSSSNASVSLANRDNYFSRKLSSTVIRNRELRIKFADFDEGLTSAVTLFAGDISKFELRDGVLRLEARNTRFDDLFNSKISDMVPLIDALNFPTIITGSLPSLQSATLVPLVFGRLPGTWGTSNTFGRIAGYLVDTLASGNPFVYVFGARPHGSGSTPVGPNFYRYGVSTGSGTLTTAVYNGNTYSVLTFATEQRDANRLDQTELTGDVNGVTENDSTTATPILNPVRALEFFLENYTDLASGDFNATLQTEAKTNATSMLYDEDGDNLYRTPVFGAAIVDSEFTAQDVIEKFCETFAMQLYVTNSGEIATFVDTDNPPSSQTADFSVTDESDIIVDSFFISSNDDVAVTLQANYLYRWSYGFRTDSSPGSQFQRKNAYTIPGAATEVAHGILREVNLWYLNSSHRAIDILRIYGEYVRANAHWIEFDLPIRFFGDCELNNIVSITHWQGIDYQTYSDEVLADDPAIYLRLGETSGSSAADSSGNNLTGTYQGSPAVGNTGALTDDANTSVFLDGTNDFISVPDNALLDPGDTFTLEAWIKVSPPISISRNIFDKGANGYDLFVSTSGILTLAKNGVGDIVAATQALPVNEWRHVACTKSGSTVKLYINGVDVTGVVSNQTITATSSDLYIGNSNPSGNFFYGYMDEPAIYPTALSPNRILRHYRTGAGNFRTGYVDALARITALEYNIQPRSAHIHVKCFKRPDYVSAKDSFVRSNSNSLGSGWTESESAATVFQILTNRLVMKILVNGERGVALRTETFGNNQIARMMLTQTAQAEKVAGIFVRGSGTYTSFTGYAAVVHPNAAGSIVYLELRKFVAQDINTLGTLLGSQYALAPPTITGYKIEVRVEGSQIDVYVYHSTFSSLAISVTDSSITSGTPGILYTDTGAATTPKTAEWVEFDARDF